jgi:uncharacterized membrane protein YagU involved in acid resistance
MKKVIIGGLLAGVVILLMGMVFGAMSAEMYKLSPKVFWKPMGGDWFTKMVIFDFVTGLILAGVFSIVKGALPGVGLMKGLSFGLIIWIVGPLLGLTMTYLTMAIRVKLIAVWTVNGLVNYLLSGLIFELLDEKLS